MIFFLTMLVNIFETDDPWTKIPKTFRFRHFFLNVLLLLNFINVNK